MGKRLLALMGVVCIPLLSLLVLHSRLSGQEIDCTSLRDAYDIAFERCESINDNWLCYGTESGLVAPESESFWHLGAHVPITRVRTIETDSATGTILLQLFVEETRDTADLAGSMVAVAFGGVKLAAGTGVTQGLTIFDPGKNVCRGTPAGLLLRTPPDITGTVRINGAGINLGSTAYVVLDDDQVLEVANLDGNVQVERSVALTPGYSVQVDVKGDTPAILGTPFPSDLAQSELAGWMTDLWLPQITNYNRTELACGSVVSGTLWLQDQPHEDDKILLHPSHECLYEICGEEGDIFTVEMTAKNDELDPWIDLRDEQLQLVAIADDSAQGENDALLCNRRLPETGCYTVVARSNRNESSGPFSLRVQGETSCEPVPAYCYVVTADGLNLRSRPDLQAPRIRVLEQGTRVEAAVLSGDKQWYEVTVSGTSERGWIWGLDGYARCQATPTVTATPSDTPTTTPTPTRTVTPTNTPSPTNTKPSGSGNKSTPLPPTKQSPFADP